MIISELLRRIAGNGICGNCLQRYIDHADGKCLFDATLFRKMTPREEKLYSSGKSLAVGDRRILEVMRR